MAVEASIGAEIPVAAVIPFASLLLGIAVLPLLAPHFWERNRNKALVAAACALPVAAWMTWAFGAAGVHQLLEKGQEYLSFIALIGTLFIVTGGIHVRGSLSGTPLMNTALLAGGALLANLVGTTGASMLLIYPLLRANRSRVQRVHIVVFFIFIVSNCGGLLTPLGDPPLYLGFLKGVPFQWTLGLWPQWLLVNGALLLLFNVWDQVVFAREERERPGSQMEEVQVHQPLAIDGAWGIAWLGAVVAVVYAAGSGAFNGGAPWPFGVAEACFAAIAFAAWWSGDHAHRRANAFEFAPLVEVAVLFAGIFVTMAPALLLLNARAAGLGIEAPWQYFWATGALSSFLDNAPTYLAFAAAACGVQGIPLEGRYLADFLATGPVAAETLAAISTGAVFMGANTYIGNGPNLMVKAIAERQGVSMPGFFGYMAYSAVVLLPLFGVVTAVFFRGG
jgi:Na+/H+ antiporter NhaD/arsenite permease-like protein